MFITKLKEEFITRSLVVLMWKAVTVPCPFRNTGYRAYVKKEYCQYLGVGVYCGTSLSKKKELY
jgi:hypothetical protein